jgi:hypothetical protein
MPYPMDTLDASVAQDVFALGMTKLIARSVEGVFESVGVKKQQFVIMRPMLAYFALVQIDITVKLTGKQFHRCTI